ncbi:MAG: glycosyltransferase family 39 protein [Chloroflexi bacterium]|nr:glycosyltransferase family 39 protein [Chloroflexota bacterium]
MIILVPLSIAALAIRLFPVFLAPRNLVRYVADDAFYYFQISKNIATGGGVTFDGLNKTNGFHPIYVVLLVVLFRWFPNSRHGPIRAALVFLGLLNVATAWFVYAFVLALAGPWAALFASAVWLFNPAVIYTSLQGTEASIWVFLGALSAYLWFWMRLTGNEGAWTVIFLLGMLTGLAFLARSEAILLFGAIGLDLFLVSQAGSIVLSVARVALYSIGALLVVSPWLAWNSKNFGKLTQTSGDIIAYHRHHVALLGTTGLFRFVNFVRLGMGNTVYAFNRFLDFVLGDRIITALFSGIVIGVLLAGPGLALSSFSLRDIAFLVVFITLVILFYGGWLWNFQDWYFLFACFAGTIFVGIGGRVLLETPLSSETSALTVFAILLVLVFAAIDIRTGVRGRLKHQPVMYEAARWLYDNTDKDVRIGSFNSGIIGYYSDRTVVNLDGVINNEAAFAIRRGQLLEYIRETNIKYVVDFEIGVKRYGSFMGGDLDRHLNPVKKFEGTWHGTQLTVYKVL